ncbi:hypothetical protein Rsub_09125 [Raphidocelis subcapitata]|uniref:NADH:ubiquinone reductase (non-electrogenic) n=1 Tax=Raphidocelis subcapitata TaxID=307507 RepID=A0A2V0PC80_9CHLO|nr:hypothetical protein Rsub_09125 [Raphidocelis subcapitata]|eukprot:GBF96542.1 hypothetical protein Rsub_09125 [Raphidocelis subcapitata]
MALSNGVQTRVGRRPGALASRPAAAAPRNRIATPVRPNRSSTVVRAIEVPSPTSDKPHQLSVDEIDVYASIDSATLQQRRPRIVVLGSGWAGASFLKALPSNVKDKYEVIMVSPRNYFLYTPLLPAVCTGTMEERSIVEPVRNLVKDKGDYYEAVCKAIDPKKKELVACFPKDAGLDEACFKISYDTLVVGVGSVNNTFGIKGVQEHCFFFKSIEDAKALRRRVSECFERAALPATSDDERRKLLSFVVVGGGPTGVEVAAELHDMIFEDLKELYPTVIKDVRIRVVELMDHVLSTYDRRIGEYTAQQWKRTGIELVLNSRVASVRDGYVNVVNKANEETELPFGACVWATGIAMNPLLKQIQEVLPGQSHFRCLLTDEFLRVKGSDGSIWAFGDAATIDQPKAVEYVDRLFEQADTDRSGALCIEELRLILKEASKEFSHLEEHARVLDAKSNGFAGVMRNFWQSQPAAAATSPLNTVEEDTSLTKEQFKELLQQIDAGLRALPATAQVAKQQGEYIGKLLSGGALTGTNAAAPAPEGAKPFRYHHKGSLAYVGGDKAVMDVPSLGPIFGTGAGILWKSYETFAQISLRNQLLVATDWIRTKVFGRDISRF